MGDHGRLWESMGEHGRAWEIVRISWEIVRRSLVLLEAALEVQAEVLARRLDTSVIACEELIGDHRS